MKYITLPLDTDPEDLIEDAFQFLQDNIPGWTPSDGQLDVWMIQAISSAAAELRDVASAVPDTIFRYFGTLAGIPPQDESAATTSTTWTMINNAGYTIEAGTQVGIRTAGDDLVPFITLNTVVIPPGSTVTAAGAIQIQAVDAGAAGSGLGTIGGPVELIDTLDFVLSIVQTAVTVGGEDAEEDDTYLDRLTTELTLLAPRPILPNDFAIFARQIDGVYRAVAVDGYNPANATFNNLRMVAVALQDTVGNNVSTPVKNAVTADLQSRREVNFVVNVMDMTRTEIDVTYQVKKLANYDSADLLTRINAAITAYLNPASWGVPPNGDQLDWINNPVVRYLEMAQIINGVEGVDYITTTAGNYDLTIGVHLGAMARLDVALSGPAPVPHANTLIGTIT